MTRTVSSAYLTAAGLGITQPVYFVEIQWPTFSTRLSTFGTLAWNGNSWLGGGIEITGFGDDGAPQGLTLADPDSAYRTLVLSTGLRDRRINIWLADAAALDVGDPVMLFTGFADSVDMGGGRLTVQLLQSASSRQFTPRDRIGPSIGVNFVAPPGHVVYWNATKIILQEG